MKVLLHACALALCAAHIAPVSAKEGDWVVRLRATSVSPDESSKLVGAIGDRLAVDANTIPEIDVSYYLTDNIAAELILAIGTRHDVTLKGSAVPGLNPGGNVDLGSVNLLPPTLLLQWHFNPDQRFDPYIGAGLNYTRFMDNSLLGGAIHVDRNSVGPALQVGMDYNLDNGWLFNIDVKRLWIDTDVRLNGVGRIDRLDIDPWLFSVGVGRRF